jgi:hypothetical protein
VSDAWLVILSTLALVALVGIMLYDNLDGLASSKMYDPPQHWQGIDP